LQPAGLLSRPRRPLSRGSSPASYPPRPLASYRTHRHLSGWNPPPLEKRAFRAHTVTAPPIPRNASKDPLTAGTVQTGQHTNSQFRHPAVGSRPSRLEPPCPLRHTPSRRPHGSMNLRNFEAVNGLRRRRRRVERAPLTASKLRKKEASMRSTALAAKAERVALPNRHEIKAVLVSGSTSMIAEDRIRSPGPPP